MSNITDINIAFPDAAALQLRLAIGACRLRITPGDGPQWVMGMYEDASNLAPLRIVQEGGNVSISQEFSWPETLGKVTQPARLDLRLGKGAPYTLLLEGGASEGEINLGGLPLRSLEIKYGAGKQEFDFSAPNPVVMDKLSVAAGAAGIEFEHLANANFVEMTLDGGAASFELNFGGALQRNATAKINAGMAAIQLEVPTTTATKVTTEAVLGGVEVGDGFMKREGAFWNEAALAGKTPTLTISAKVVMGGIEIKLTGDR